MVEKEAVHYRTAHNKKKKKMSIFTGAQFISHALSIFGAGEIAIRAQMGKQSLNFHKVG